MVRGILKTKNIILNCVLRNIGDGRKVKFWSDPWMLINDTPTCLDTFLFHKCTLIILA